MLINLEYILSSFTYDLILLNRPNISELYKKYQTTIGTKIWTDGAAKRMYEELGSDEERSRYLPNIIIGDMDSISSEASSFYSACFQEKDNDQDSTDLTKALKISQNSTIIVLTDFWGRLDHTLGAFSAIAHERHSHKQIFILSDSNIAFVIRNEAEVVKPEWKYCGILPIFGKTWIKTEGLKWNLNGESEYGRLVSTSNEFISNAIIKSSVPVLFVISKE